MFTGPPYHFKVVVGEKDYYRFCKKEVDVTPFEVSERGVAQVMYYTDSETKKGVPLFVFYFKDKSCINCGVVAHEAVHAMQSIRAETGIAGGEAEAYAVQFIVHSMQIEIDKMFPKDELLK